MASLALAGLTILMLGDSHFATQGYLVTTLQDRLIRQGAHVTTYAACGEPTGIWVSGGAASCGAAMRVQSGPVQADHGKTAHVPSFDQIIAAVHPNLVIIGAGDTMAGYGQAQFPADWVTRQVHGLTARIQAANLSCIWIGPGWGTEGGPFFKTYAKAQAMDQFLSTHVAPCGFIDSTTLSKPGEWTTFDGQHYTAAGYEKWGAALDAQIVAMVQHKQP